MDEMRRTAMAERAEILARTRAEAEAEIAAASAKLAGREPKTHAAGSRRTPTRWAPPSPNASWAARPPDSLVSLNHVVIRRT